MSWINNKFSKSIFFGLLLILVVVVIIVQYKKNEEVIAEPNPVLIDKLELMRTNILGKELHQIDTIISKEKYESDSSKLIGYYHSYDCGGCVNKLMNAIAQADSISPDIAIYLISDKLDNMSPVVKHNLEKPYFVDENGAFQEWTNFSYTPMLLYLDKNERIMEVYFPTTPSYKKSRSRFFEYLSMGQDNLSGS